MRAAALACALASGCATLTAPRTDLLSVESNPPGATIVVDGRSEGTTPASVEVERARPYPPQVELHLPGYQPAACRTRMQSGTGYVVADALLCLFLFPFGCIAFIDATGAWNELDTPTCYQTLVPAGGAPSGLPPPGYAPPADATPLPLPPPPPQL